jgi:hypothetical protein
MLCALVTFLMVMQIYCNVNDKALLGNDSVKQQWKYQFLLVVAEQQAAHQIIRRLAKRSGRCYAMTQYTRVNNGGGDIF